MRPIEVEGKWWLPSHPERQVVGTLTLSADEFTLDLRDHLVEPAPPKRGVVYAGFGEPITEPIILGQLRTGDQRRITLLESSGRRETFPGTVESEIWHPVAALQGAHFMTERALSFTAITTSFDYLRDWATPPDVQHTMEMEEDRSRITVSAQGRQLDNAVVNAAELSLELAHSYSLGGRRAELEQDVRFDIQLPSPIEWRAALSNWVNPLRDLLSFATTVPNRIEWVSLRYEPEAPNEWPWVTLLVRLVDFRRRQREERELWAGDMLFPLAAVDGGLANLLPRWFELHRKLDAGVLQPFFSVDYAPFIWDESRFLAVAQAAEVLHREVIGGTPLPKSTHRARVRRVENRIDDRELREWAKDVLGQSNFLRLNDRLQSLVDQTPLGAEIVERCPDFVASIVRTRNYLTHRSRKIRVLEGPARYFHGEALRWLIRVTLMAELGFTPAAAAEAFRQVDRFDALLERLAAHA